VKTLIFGRTGQLGRALVAAAPSGATVVALDRNGCDLTSPEQIRNCIREHAPQVVINAAAYTAVDRAESERELAFAINDVAVAVMAGSCAAAHARLVHVSTDFVFNGEAGRPYRSQDTASPLNVYGMSKLSGERRISETPGLDWRIVRTAWVYSASGSNFMLTMLRHFRESDEVAVVVDQVGTPTSARSLAECLWRAALDNGESTIFHFTDAGVASWYDFAAAIYDEARSMRLIEKDVRIVPISAEDFPSLARRPTYSVLDKFETMKRLSLSPVHWRVRLREVLREVLA
jgi:dTDP-4-dehydrorhamnose reductase